MIAFTDNEVEAERQEEIVRLLKNLDTTIAALGERYQCELGAREALHTAYIMHDNVESYLSSHPCVTLDPEAYRFAHAAATALFNLYQRIGEIEESFRSAEETTGSEE